MYTLKVIVEEKMPDIVLSDDGTLDTLFTCNDCDEEMRYNYDPESGESYEEFVKWALADARVAHECPGGSE